MVNKVMRSLWLGLFLAALAAAPAHAAPKKLAEIEAELEERFDRIDHLAAAELAAWQAAGEDILLIDTRAAEEFSVSRLEEALRVAPKTPLAKAGLGDTAVAGKKVVVYCSVGWRSSVWAEKNRESLLEAGAVSVANLKGGIFAWHNAGRPLTDDAGASDLVHPYDRTWGKLVERSDKTAYAPD